MSMHDYPSSGYVMELDVLKCHLPAKCHKQLNKAVEETDWDKILKIVDENLPKKFPKPTDICYLYDDDFSEDLYKNTIYCIFDESDLFVKAPSDALTAMMDAGLPEPKNSHWTVWG